MVMTQKNLFVTAMRDQVRLACGFVEDIAIQAGLNNDGVFQSQLCVEEIFTNIVEHGYDNLPTQEQVEIVCSYDDTIFRIEILDSTPPFNPLELSEPNPARNLWDREGGGWGVYFVRQYMSKVQYEYRNQQNCLLMQRNIT